LRATALKRSSRKHAKTDRCLNCNVSRHDASLSIGIIIIHFYGSFIKVIVLPYIKSFVPSHFVQQRRIRHWRRPFLSFLPSNVPKKNGSPSFLRQITKKGRNKLLSQICPGFLRLGGGGLVRRRKKESPLKKLIAVILKSASFRGCH